jgi:hypothetical protein
MVHALRGLAVKKLLKEAPHSIGSELREGWISILSKYDPVASCGSIVGAFLNSKALITSLLARSGEGRLSSPPKKRNLRKSLEVRVGIGHFSPHFRVTNARYLSGINLNRLN